MGDHVHQRWRVGDGGGRSATTFFVHLYHCCLARHVHPTSGMSLTDEQLEAQVLGLSEVQQPRRRRVALVAVVALAVLICAAMLWTHTVARTTGPTAPAAAAAAPATAAPTPSSPTAAAPTPPSPTAAPPTPPPLLSAPWPGVPDGSGRAPGSESALHSTSILSVEFERGVTPGAGDGLTIVDRAGATVRRLEGTQLNVAEVRLPGATGAQWLAQATRSGGGASFYTEGPVANGSTLRFTARSVSIDP